MYNSEEKDGCVQPHEAYDVFSRNTGSGKFCCVYVFYDIFISTFCHLSNLSTLSLPFSLIRQPPPFWFSYSTYCREIGYKCRHAASLADSSRICHLSEETGQTVYYQWQKNLQRPRFSFYFTDKVTITIEASQDLLTLEALCCYVRLTHLGLNLEGSWLGVELGKQKWLLVCQTSAGE